MKNTIILLILIIQIIGCEAQPNLKKSEFILQHQLRKDELVCYKLINKEWKGDLKFFSESEFENNSSEEEMNKFATENQQFLLMKKRDDNLINVSLITITERDSNRVKIFGIDPWDKDENKTIRAIINTNGVIESFYLPRTQKNIFSMFLEYPDTPIQVGASWEIDFQMTQVSGNFRCQEYSKRNVVQLEEIDKEKGLAKIGYSIEEKIRGNTNSFLPSSKTQTTEIYGEVHISGESEYSITKNRLIKSRMTVKFEGKGIMEGKTTMVQELILLDEVPREVIEIDKK